MKRVTAKQAAIVRERIKNPHATQKEIGRKLGVDQRYVARELTKPHVAAAMREQMDRRPKLISDALLERLEEGLEAKETKFFAHEGEVISKRETVDYGTRHRYLDTALRLRGELRNDGPTTNIAMFTPEALDALIAATNRRDGP